MTPKKLMLIVNPFSGKGLSKSALGVIVPQLCNSGFAVDIFYAGEYDPGALAYNNAKNHDLAVCVGGDGTLSAVISGILHSGVSIPVGYIPAGTANDVATTLALSKKPSVAVQTIINGTPKPLDIGLFAGRYFTYIAAFGAFTDVSYKTPRSTKRALGHLAYVLGGLAEVTSIKAMRTKIEYDGGVIWGDYIFGAVANSTSVAGLVKLDPRHVDLSDGMFEVILVKQPMGLANLMNILSNIMRKSYDGDNVLMLHSSRIKFTFDSGVTWTVDGENGGLHKEVEITNCREAIKVIF
jgi:YegS/Rv2252/BmrU family lipid kinase